MISQFNLWTLAPKTDMLLDIMLVAILWAMCKPCCYYSFATPEVAICTEHIVIPTLGIGILFKAQWLEYALEHIV
jgi:hypothetical protein